MANRGWIYRAQADIFVKCHCVKSVQIRSYFWSVFSDIWTEYLSVFSPNAEKYGPEITPYLGTFRAVV